MALFIYSKIKFIIISNIQTSPSFYVGLPSNKAKYKSYYSILYHRNTPNFYTKFSCSLDEAAGVQGARSPLHNYHKPYNSEADFAVEWSRRQWGTGGFPVPRCRLRNGTAKILSVNGLRGGDFAGGFPAKYYLVH